MTPSNPDDARYTLADLADLAGVTPRTVRYYLAQGLLPTVGVSGPGAKYDDGHLARLRLIRQLQREHLPLAEIRRRLEALDDAAVVALADAPPPPPTDSALEYLRRIGATGGPTAAPTPAPAASTAASIATPAGTPVSLGDSAAAMPTLGRAMRLSVAPPSPGVMPARDLGEPRPSETSAHPTRSQWERISLAPDVELHIRRPLARATSKRVDRLIEIARDLLEEDQS